MKPACNLTNHPLDRARGGYSGILSQRHLVLPVSSRLLLVVFPIVLFIATIRQFAQIRYLLASISLVACALFYIFRRPLQNTFFDPFVALQNRPPSPYTPVTADTPAMQSVKIVEAVTKQTGTVIFLHVSVLPCHSEIHLSTPRRLCRVSETPERHSYRSQRSYSSNTRTFGSSFLLRKRCRSL